nr:hypothetical protein Iba_chr13aCG4790 [Ipomoea batatas]GME13594.1 hypothetical protein Iba_scaffold14563CG0030 [Ipomoea batatas]GME15435.1 hypothetical protein Iba_scaffold16188CG0010 [Ipomoea batatas]GME15437.1 hypothetical protein Iba_scaffold16189CG0020 [Ipomoea batatas]
MIACSSTAGFHHGSCINTLEAAVRFKPTPPAFRDISKTIFSVVSLNSCKTFSLCFCWVFPSNLKNPMPLFLRGISRRSRNKVHWLKTMLFSPEPESRIRCRQSISFVTFEDSFQSF